MWEVTTQKDSILQRYWHTWHLRKWGVGGFTEASVSQVVEEVERVVVWWAEKAAVWLGDWLVS